MARLILDTGVVIALERGSWDLDEVVPDEDDVAIAAVSAAELRYGVHVADAGPREVRRNFLEEFFLSVPILDYDLAVARAHARLLAQVHRAGTTRGALDLVIAATAAARERTVLTTDVKGFADLPGIDVRVLT